MKTASFALSLCCLGVAACSPSVGSQPGTEIAELTHFPLEHISSGFMHTCGIVHGDVACFGDDGEGQIPDFDPGGKTQSVEYDGTAAIGLLKLGDAVQVAAGTSHNCAIAGDDRHVVCWGDSQNGALGGGNEVEENPGMWPITVLDLTGAIDVAVDASGVTGQTSCAIVDGGANVACWGAVFGLAQQASVHATPVVLPEVHDVLAIGIGNAFGCAITAADRGVVCWGLNFSGQLGDPALGTDAEVLAHAVPGIHGVTSLAVGGEHVCVAMPGDGHGVVKCWGRDDVGQVGDAFIGPIGGKHPRLVRSPFELPLDADRVVASEQASCALGGAHVTCWGSVGTQDGSVTTVPISVQDLDDAKEVSVGVNFGCAVDAAKRTRCWGDNLEGQLAIDNGSASASFFGTPIDTGF